MTEKRYYNIIPNGIEDTVDNRIIRGSAIGDELNRLSEENEQLKQQNETLSDLNNQELSEYEHRVFDIIDDKIAEVSDEKYKAINQQDVSAMLCFEAMIELLKELRNELKR